MTTEEHGLLENPELGAEGWHEALAHDISNLAFLVYKQS